MRASESRAPLGGVTTHDSVKVGRRTLTEEQQCSMGRDFTICTLSVWTGIANGPGSLIVKQVVQFLIISAGVLVALSFQKDIINLR